MIYQIKRYKMDEINEYAMAYGVLIEATGNLFQMEVDVATPRFYCLF